MPTVSIIAIKFNIKASRSYHKVFETSPTGRGELSPNPEHGVTVHYGERTDINIFSFYGKITKK